MKQKQILIPGEIWLGKHINDNNKLTYHPFLIVLIDEGIAYGLQFSSVKIDNNGNYQSHFSSKTKTDTYLSILDNLFSQIYNFNDQIIDLDVSDGLKNWSQAKTTLLNMFDLSNNFIENYNFKYKTTIDNYKFLDILRKLSLVNWENNSLKQKFWLAYLKLKNETI